MKVELLTQADRILSRCGRYIAPKGYGWIDIPYGIQYSKFLPSGTNDSTEDKLVQIDRDAVFVWKAFQGFTQPSDGAPKVYWRLRIANGKYLQNRLIATEELSAGSWRFAVDPPVVCAPNSRFFITTDGLVSASSDVALTVLLEGALRFTIKGSAGCGQILGRGEPYSTEPRWRSGDPNQNILAPEWRMGGECFPETPPGYSDEPYWLMTPLAQAVKVPITGAVVSSQLLIGLSSDFVVRNWNFIQTTGAGSAGAAGTLFVRIRDAKGCEITDGFVWANRISTVMFPEYWVKIKDGEALYLDYMLVDASGPGGSSVTVQPVAGGVRRVQGSL